MIRSKLRPRFFVVAFASMARADLDFRGPAGGNDAAVDKFRRQAKFDCLVPAGELADIDRIEPAQRLDDVFDQHFRRRRAGGDADRFGVLEPVRIELAAVGDQIARRAGFFADFAQPVGVRTVLGADHQDDVDKLAQLANRGLAILRRVADVARLRSDDIGETVVQGGDDTACVVHAQRRLRYIGDRRVGRNVEPLDVSLGLDQSHRLGDLAHRALDFGVAGMADEYEAAALCDIALALIVHLGDQGAGRIEHRQIARGGLLLDALGHAVRAEDRHRVGRHFGEVLDKARAFGLQALDHVLVVHDLVAHIDRRAEFLQRPLDDFDGAHDAGAKTTRLGQYHFHQDLPVRHRFAFVFAFNVFGFNVFRFKAFATVWRSTARLDLRPAAARRL